MKYKSNKGITLAILIVTVTIMLILASVAISAGIDQIERTRLEDLKTTMLLIKGRTKIVVDKETFGEKYNSSGMVKLANAKLYDTSNLQHIFENIDTSNLYIWGQTAMNNNNINVTITYTDFFVIDYATEEVYYSLGCTYQGNTYYSLTEMQGV